MAEDKEILLTVLTKIKTVAVEDYDGDIRSNVLPIFNRLTTVEKKTLLRSVLTVYYLNGSLSDTWKISSSESDYKESSDSEPSFEEMNKTEQMKLKVWLIKLVSYFLTAYAMLSLFYHQDPKNGISLIEKVFNIVADK